MIRCGSRTGETMADGNEPIENKSTPADLHGPGGDDPRSEHSLISRSNALGLLAGAGLASSLSGAPQINRIYTGAPASRGKKLKALLNRKGFMVMGACDA